MIIKIRKIIAQRLSQRFSISRDTDMYHAFAFGNATFTGENPSHPSSDRTNNNKSGSSATLTIINPQTLSSSPFSMLDKENLSASSNRNKFKDLLRIPWHDLIVPWTTYDEMVIGSGSFGTVMKAEWLESKVRSNGLVVTGNLLVVVKMLIVDRRKHNTSDIDKFLLLAEAELKILQEAEHKMLYKDCIVRLHGITVGEMPEHVAKLLDISPTVPSMGIVMR
jgi:hypothetical protein